MELTSEQINYCMECGVCTGSCPISQVDTRFSPRQMIKRTLEEQEEDILQNRDIWACLSCARCSDRCPVEIDFPEFIRSYRAKARERNNFPHVSHHGIFHTLVNLQTGNINQNRTAWATDAGKFREQGEYYLFVGCLPYYDIFFRYLDLSCIDIAKSMLKLLNKVDIEPVISNEECCCGHDALWSGNEEQFLELGKKNIEQIKASGASTVIFGCPEGYMNFKYYYPKYFGNLPFEVIHLSELLASRIPEANISFTPDKEETITYHDPCRLGRWSGIYQQPREILKQVPGATLTEMPRNKEGALCCGTTAWMECSSCSKAMQMERLTEAEDTGANTLITACPKCQIHFSCSKTNTDIGINIKDIYTYLSEHLE